MQLKNEKRELRQMPDAELAELTGIYESKELSAQTAAQAARELTAHDPLAAHASAELKIDPENLANPWQAPAASAARWGWRSPMAWASSSAPQSADGQRDSAQVHPEMRGSSSPCSRV